MKNLEQTHNLASSDLATLAPKVTALLSKELPTSVLLDLSSAFSKVTSATKLSEFPVVRIEGASFNPKPARLLEILWRDGLVRDPLILRSALLSLALEGDMIPQGFTEEEIHLAAEAIEYDGRNDVRIGAQSIALARAIDTAWHLHMTNLDSNEQNKTATKLECILTHSKNKNLFPRMCQLLETSLIRFRRRKVS